VLADDFQTYIDYFRGTSDAAPPETP